MHQDFYSYPALCAPVPHFGLLDKLLLRILKDHFRVLHDIIGVHDSKLPLEEFRGAVHIRSTIPTIIEDNYIHSQILSVVL
jgi:hypothetical protein